MFEAKVFDKAGKVLLFMNINAKTHNEAERRVLNYIEYAKENLVGWDHYFITSK